MKYKTRVRTVDLRPLKRWSVLAIFAFLLLTFLNCASQAYAAESKLKSDPSELQASLLESASLVDRIDMYRLYNKYTGEHFYTGSTGERDNLVRVGWKNEGTGWIAPTISKTPVYRLYNPYVPGGDHHYTTGEGERDKLVEAGWRAEGIGWYSVDEDDSDRISVYRQYNPYAQTGTHNYTTSKAENDSLVRAGWKAEGEGWYAYEKKEIDITEATVTLTDNLEYNGTTQTQNIEVSGTQKTLELDTDYTIIGNTAKDAGTYTLTITGKGNYVGTIEKTFTVSKRKVSVKEIKAYDKRYDQTTNAKLDISSVVLDGVCEGDDVRLQSVNAVFLDKNAGEGKDVLLSDYVLTGDDIANYEFSTEDSITKTSATISPIAFTVSGIVVNDKTYDTTDEIHFDYSNVMLQGVYDGDDVELESVKARFSDPWAGFSKVVILSDYSFTGEDLQNYTFDETNSQKLNATIYQKGITIASLSLKERIYEEGNTSVELNTETATFNEGDILGDDDVRVADATYNYNDANAGDNKAVRLTSAPALTGEHHANYYVAKYPETIYGDILAIVEFNTNCVQTIDDAYIHLNNAVDTPEQVYRDGLEIENWYTDEKCSDGKVWVFKEGDTSTSATKVTQNVTPLYANWVPSSGPEGDLNKFWIAQASTYIPEGQNVAPVANTDYKSEIWNVKKSYSEILGDIKTIQTEAQEGVEGPVTKEYKEMMQSDKYHLYTKYKGSTNTYLTGGPSDNGTQSQKAEMNSYMEARIIHVGTHDSEGTTLTFQSVYLLPQAISMRSTETNAGGWALSNPYSAINSNAESITCSYAYKDSSGAKQVNGKLTYTSLTDGTSTTATSFNKGFYDAIVSLKKKYNLGNAAGASAVATAEPSKMWLLSFNEIDSKADSDEWVPASGTEGTTYDWFKLHGIDGKSTVNKALSYTTRNGQIPRNNYDAASASVWLRSTSVTSSKSFMYFDANGKKGNTDARCALGIAPAFAM